MRLFKNLLEVIQRNDLTTIGGRVMSTTGGSTTLRKEFHDIANIFSNSMIQIEMALRGDIGDKTEVKGENVVKIKKRLETALETIRQAHNCLNTLKENVIYKKIDKNMEV